MTEQEIFAEFLGKLRTVPEEWSFWGNGMFRTKRGGLCPIAAVRRHLHPCPYMLNLPGQLANQIASAADNLHYHDPRIRRELLNACGLKEPL